MCGITGFLDPSHSHNAEQLTSRAAAMAETLRHRGPDDSGAWTDAEAGIALGFRRLAIIDLSPAGHQPMLSADGRYGIAYNGEVYNFAELRGELQGGGHAFRGSSDTEVMLAAVCEWGLEAAVQRFNGMFAFALWDRQERRLHLVRDRIGIKPLYYGWMGGVFVFGSELKALKAHPAFVAEVDRDALALYLRHNYVPGPHSIYRNVFKLPAGSILSVDGSAPAGTLEPHCYWSARQAAEAGVSSAASGDDVELIERLDATLRASVRQCMVADVPLGAFLSGGVDSSTVVALMQAQSSRPVRTFTIGFEEAGFDEAGYARAVARHLGTEHTELTVTPAEARAVIPRLPDLYDEPFADASQIPTFLVSQLARQHVTVSLSGDGGDELFGGYDRYFQTRRLWAAGGWVPAPLRAGLGRLAASVTSGDWLPRLTNRLGLPNLGDRAEKLAGILGARSVDELYVRLISYWQRPEKIAPGAREPQTELLATGSWPALPSPAERMMYIDLVGYLPDDLLVKLDRASMGVSLEGRVPFLDDHRVVEFAWQVPLRCKMRGGRGKWILRQVLYRYVPSALVERPKMGFGVPIGAWLRGPLRAWAAALLEPERLSRQGFLDPAAVSRKWGEHLTGKRNWQFALWGILMFQAWLEANA
jgi:asparagine synthase (glutamine-hydrolysing)